MRILILGMNYAPEVTGIAPYTTGLAEHLAAHGHEVVVATTFPHYPQWKVAKPYDGHFRQKEQRAGVEVRRTAVSLPKAGSTLSRVVYDSSLAVGALLHSLRMPRADVVFCISPPIQLGLSAALLARYWRAPLLLLVKDLPLDAGLNVGLIRPGRMLRFGRRLERFVYRLVDRIIAISPGIGERILAQGVPPPRLKVIPDWADTQLVLPLASDSITRALLGAGGDDFLVVHAGNQGRKQGLILAVEAMAKVDPKAHLVLTLVGDGSERRALEGRARQLALRNVHFVPLQPANLFNQTLCAADVLLLSQVAAITNSVIPSKLLTYMAAGRPVLAAVNTQSEAARLIVVAHCGLLVPPEDPEALARAVEHLARDAELRERMGTSGRRYVERHHDRAQILAQLVAEISETVVQRRYAS